jgi:FMN phosphatase YigB (HAD superfamily)
MRRRHSRTLSNTWETAQLRLWPRVLFVDWHGVLSDASLWYSIRSNDRHPFRQRLELKTNHLFRENWPMVAAWMRGDYSSESIVNYLDITPPASARSDYFLRKLYSDCRRMPIYEPMVEALKWARTSSYVVIATDNMDCFIDAARERRDIRRFADDIISSSDVGVLKAEDPHGFFGGWLHDHGLTFADALLVDDGKDNCRAFSDAGGDAHYVSSPPNASEVIRTIVQESLEPRLPS